MFSRLEHLIVEHQLIITFVIAFSHYKNNNFWWTFLELLQDMSSPNEQPLGIVAEGLLQARCPSCYPTNSIKKN